MSHRIVIAGHVHVEPEKRAAALKDARPLIEAALAEPGCIEYAWTADPHDPTCIRVFEEWVSEPDLAAHLVGQPYRGMLAHLQGVGILNAVTQKYRVDHFEPVYDPQGVPRANFFTARA